LRILNVFVVLPGPQDLTSVIGGHSKTLERIRDFIFYLLQAHIVYKNFDKVPHLGCSGDMQVICFKGIVDMFCQVRIFLEVGIGKVRIFVTGATWGHKVEPGFFGLGQVPGC
jgi:hypothetical protein